jgi:hypothetical protein
VPKVPVSGPEVPLPEGPSQGLTWPARAVEDYTTARLVEGAPGLGIHDLLLWQRRQVPVKSGSRFSMKAFMASMRSSEMRNEEFHCAM